MLHVALFEKLTKHRRRHAEILNDPDFAGIRRMVTHRHQNDTHFIYELLQNANDAQAHEACFALYPDGLAFYHDAIRHKGAPFTITDPDLPTDPRGHVNAITSIGHGTKSDNPDDQPQQGNTIGKFGTGFKSVFVFTKTPHIYDQHFAFRIEDLIVPNLLQNQEATPPFPWDATQYPTLFWFPFNAGNAAWAAKAHTDIAEALTSLRFPLLFLPTLRGISWQVFQQPSRTPRQLPTAHGAYKRHDAPIQAEAAAATAAQLTSLVQETSGPSSSAPSVTTHRFLTLTRPAPGRADLSTVLAFAIRPDGSLQTEETYETFCYFRTSEDHGLRFIVQAPWSLGDSRELLRGSDPWNNTLITQAGELLADALPLFRDLPPFPQITPVDATATEAFSRPTSLLTDELLQLLPIDSAPRDAATKRKGLSFLPLSAAATAALKSGRLLPTSTGQHVHAHNAYLSESDDLLRTFAEPQLRHLTADPEAAWIFPTLNKNRAELVDYVLTLLPGGRPLRSFTPPKLVKNFTEAFAAAQSLEWFTGFYTYLKTTASLFEAGGALRKLPFLRLETTEPTTAAPQHASPWHPDDTPRVFLPADSPIPGIPTLHPIFVSDATLAGFRQLLGLTKPDLLAAIESQVLDRYKPSPGINVTEAEHLAHYRTLLQCWHETAADPPRRARLCELLADKNIIRQAGKTGALAWSRPGRIYFPAPELTTYFHATHHVAFIDTSFYAPLQPDYDSDQLRQFWLAIGVVEVPRIVTSNEDPTPDDAAARKLKQHNAKNEKVQDFNLDQIFDNLTADPSPEWSYTLYSFLLTHIRSQRQLLQRIYYYFYWNDQYIFTPAALVKLLLQNDWLYDRDGQRHPTSYFHGRANELAPQYDQQNDAARQLLRALGIQDERDALLSKHLTPQEIEALNLLTQQLKGGRSVADILTALRLNPLATGSDTTGTKYPPDAPGPTTPITDPKQRPTPIATLPATYLELRRQAYAVARRAREEQELDRIKALQNHQQPRPDAPDEQPDTDPTTAAADRSNKSIEREQQRAVERVDNMMRRAQLDAALDPASGYPKYSFAWCQTALELESLLSGEQAEATTELRVTFAHAALDPVDKQHRTLILRDPARYIPRNIEDRGNLELELSLTNGTTKSVLVDVASVKDFTLRVKLAKANALTDAGITLADVHRFTIRVQSPAFLSEELRLHFNGLARAPYNFAPTKDLYTDLPAPPKIRFIFGPPGTGKTQHIADNEIRRLMNVPGNLTRILVLTPTNKAADILTKRLLITSPNDPGTRHAPEWLVRFGTSADPDLDPIPGLVQGPSADLFALDRCTVITTIARFPYATFGPTMPGQLLAVVQWDYIILDEASMIPLVAALNVIYHCAPTCKEFIIGGDPLQIPPVVLAPQLAEENIYSLVQLNDFQTRTTKPHQYPVVPLTTQYRATPPLGELFSRFSYRGLLSHARPLTGTLPNPRLGAAPFQGRQPATFGKLTLADITIIRFPVQSGESILQARRLQQGSQYHPYSGILTAEIVRHVAQHLAPRPSPATPFRIGIISPYTAQASLVREVLKQMRLPADIIDFNENVGTIHGFQGDECDLIFALFSPPEYIATVARRRGLPMLERRYILNVAISRAKDRLVLLVPDEKTYNYQELIELNSLLDLAETHTGPQGGQFLEYHADDIERALFGRADYLTSNSFSAGHQIVNVYGPTERRYEIRLSDTAIDVQFNLTAAVNSDRTAKHIS